MKIYASVLIAVLSLAASSSPARVCGESLVTAKVWSAENSPLFERLDKLNTAPEFHAVSEEQSFSVEGYCAYKTINSHGEPTGAEIIKPAFVTKKSDRVLLFVANSYEQFSDAAAVCEERVTRLRERATQTLKTDSVLFSKKDDVFQAEASDKAWRMEQKLKSNSSALVIQAKASNQSWHARLNCHFIL